MTKCDIFYKSEKEIKKKETKTKIYKHKLFLVTYCRHEINDFHHETTRMKKKKKKEQNIYTWGKWTNSNKQQQKQTNKL